MFRFNDSQRTPDSVVFHSVWHDAVGRGSGVGAVSEQTLRLITQANRRPHTHI